MKATSKMATATVYGNNNVRASNELLERAILAPPTPHRPVELKGFSVVSDIIAKSKIDHQQACIESTVIAQAVRGICTPEQHSQTNKTKPVILLALGAWPHGKTALVEFPEGWQRTIDLPTEFDGWHPMFDALQEDDMQRLRKHVRAPFVIHQNGTQSRPSPLSFTRDVQTTRGRWLKSNYFDVPEQERSDGAITGYQCAAELLDALSLGYGPFIPVHFVLAEVVKAAKGSFYGASRSAAATSFLDVAGDALGFFAKHANHRAYIHRKIAGAERNRDELAEERAMERVEFVIRMKAAKEAKLKAKEIAASGAA